ncbi:MAG: hypothetical protein J5449_04750 [Oscillospiraceae bacterium]|nr:hypothetical protein [Oscillospiraceae bacterium]
MTRGEAVLAVASREIGYHEGPGKHNKYGEWFGLDRVPWCMEFDQWCYHEAEFDLPFKTASCGELLRWYQANQPECITDRSVRGCIVIFNFPNTKYSTDHTGLFVKREGDYITTIDGNTSGGNNSNGGWVQQRTRKLSYANPTYIVPRGLEEEIVKRYNTVAEIEKELPWAVATINKLVISGALQGSGVGLDLSYDMIRLLVINDRAGAYA